MKTTGLIEVILYVRDMDQQVAFYRDSCGLTLTYPTDQSSYREEMWVTFDTGSCVLALHGGGQGRLGADAPTIVFGVEDVHAARAELVARGVSMGDVIQAAPGIRVCGGKDPEGNRFSIESRE